MPSTKSFSSSSDILSISAPSHASDSFSRIPIRFAIAAAVTLWSPVIMIGRIPALLHSATASLDSSRGGSIMAISPINVRSYSSSSVSSSSSDTTLYPNASTRRPSLEKFWFWSSIFLRSFSVRGRTSSPIWICVIRSRSTSTAPLITIVGTPSMVCLVDISFLSLSNGFSLSRGYFARTASGSSPSLLPRLIRAVSVGSPISTPSVFLESLQSILLMSRRLCDGSLTSTSAALIHLSST